MKHSLENLGEGTVLSRRSEEVESRRRLAHWQNDKDVVGLEKDVKLLLQKAILEEKEGLSIATIVGMGGIGKSTLARKIYNHSAVADRFDCRAWVVVSSEFTPGDIIIQIMLQLHNSEKDRENVLEGIKKLEELTKDKLRFRELLLDKLHKLLVGKRYFIVLDDVWESTHWESLKSAFPDGQDKRSRLLFTSRNKVIYAQYEHVMKPLDPDKSWELFLKKTFINDTDVKCPEELEYIGRKILEKCGGLPLAISVVGGLLVKQRQSKSGWEKVLKEMKCHLDRSESNIIWAILELSYHNLPSELKACFLCLGFFKEDANIRVKKLVHIWVALGFVSCEGLGGEERMEEIARGYLDELINRNMVQVKNMAEDDRIKNCQIHDLIRELSITKAKEELSFDILREEGDSQSSHKPRHPVMYCSRGRFIDSTNQNKHLRSLFVHGVGLYVYGTPSSSYWKSFERLKVLDLGCCRLGELPDAIGALIGIRYLGLRGAELSTFHLPRSLGKLRNLQVLDIRWCSLVLPDFIWKVDSLRHLYMSSIWYKMPFKISPVKNLRTLSHISLRDSNLEQLSQLTGLRKLGIYLKSNSDVSKLFTSLARLENLARLSIVLPYGSPNMEGPATLHNLTDLQLEGGMNRLPSASNFPPNLVSLSLKYTHLDEDPMPVLEKLPNLLYLKLVKMYEGQEMVISHGGFPKLKVLILDWLQRLRNIQVGKGAMSELKRLEIIGCKHLESLPKEVRLMSNLKELKMVTTTEMASKLRGVDSYIISNIPSVHLIGEIQV